MVPDMTKQSPGLLMFRCSTDWTSIRTSASWSLYSRFPDGFPVASQHRTTKPKVACALGFAGFVIRAGRDNSSPTGEKIGSPSTWPPPVTFPGVDDAPPRQAPMGKGAVSQGVKLTLGLTLAPNAGPTGPGPLGSPHQLQV